VREERGLLRDQRGLAMAGRSPEADGGVGERLAVEGDAAVTRSSWRDLVEAGEQAQQRAFAGAGGAEDTVQSEAKLHSTWRWKLPRRASSESSSTRALRAFAALE
jgi:hypothetical protein